MSFFFQGHVDHCSHSVADHSLCMNIFLVCRESYAADLKILVLSCLSRVQNSSTPPPDSGLHVPEKTKLHLSPVVLSSSSQTLLSLLVDKNSSALAFA